MAKATESELSTLHGVVAQKLTEVIRDGEVVSKTEDGTPVVKTASAAFFAVATAFLKNNDITADREKNAGLSELSDTLAKRRQERKQRLQERKSDAPTDAFEAGMASLVEQGKGLMQ